MGLPGPWGCRGRGAAGACDYRACDCRGLRLPGPAAVGAMGLPGPATTGPAATGSRPGSGAAPRCRAAITDRIDLATYTVTPWVSWEYNDSFVRSKLSAIGILQSLAIDVFVMVEPHGVFGELER